MKIMMIVTSRQRRGAEISALELSEELVRLGHEVIFLGLYQIDGEKISVRGATNLDLACKKNSFLSFTRVRQLRKLIKKHNPDIIQANGSDTLKYAVLATLGSYKRPLVYRNISIISAWISGGMKLTWMRLLFSKVDQVVSVGEVARTDFINTIRIPENKAIVISRGIMTKQVSESFLENIKEKYHIPEDAKIVFHAGRFSAEKNQEFLLRAWASLNAPLYNAYLFLIGEGTLKPALMELASELGISETVRFTGEQRDIQNFLAIADLNVLCSNIEGVPGVVIEAGLQGVPTLAVSVGGVPEVVIPGKTGYLIEEHDVTLFAQQMKALLFNKPALKRMGENARNRFLERHSLEKSAKKFVQLFESLLQRSSPKSKTAYDQFNNPIRNSILICLLEILATL